MSASTTFTDPVCGMQVTAASAAGRSEYQGETYYFCSAHCLQKFESDPASYVKGKTHSCCGSKAKPVSTSCCGGDAHAEPSQVAPPAQEQSDQRSRLEEAYTRRQAEEQQRKAQQPKPAPAPPDQEEGTDLEAELEALRNQMAPSPGSGLTTQPTARPVIETQPGADTAEPPRDLNDAFERARREAEQRAREEAVRLQQAAMERRSRTPRKPGK